MTLVLLHGAYGAPTDWEDVVAALSSSSRALTVPGHGRDDTVPAGVAVDDGWHHALDLLEARLADLGGFHLAGYSLGARLAIGLASRPSVRARLQSLTLVAGTAGLDNDDDRARRRDIDDERAAALVNNPDAFLEAFWQLPLFESLATHPERAARLAERQDRARAHPSVLAWWMRGLSPGRQPSLWSSLSSLTVPVAVVVGALDADYVIHARRVQALLPSARLTIVPGVGHALLLEAPAAVATAIAAIADQRATS